jgi:hypothetical protein
LLTKLPKKFLAVSARPFRMPSPSIVHAPVAA